MAKVFLDANLFIDLIEKRKNVDPENLEGHSLFISPLSVHILCYVYKKNAPAKKLIAMIDHFNIVDCDSTLVKNSLVGPTTDFEDNLQLHSAAKEDCDYFMTSDKQILKLGFFGKVRLVSKME